MLTCPTCGAEVRRSMMLWFPLSPPYICPTHGNTWAPIWKKN